MYVMRIICAVFLPKTAFREGNFNFHSNANFLYVKIRNI